MLMIAGGMPKFAVRTAIAGAALSVALTVSALAAGVDVNAATTGLALRGYDPVAYFTVGAPTRGDSAPDHR